MRLYALCDRDVLRSRDISFSQFIQKVKSLNGEIVQYRNKNDDVATIKNDLIELRKLWDGYLIINDHYELTSYCDGVHIGQDDLYAIDNNPARALSILKLTIGNDKIVGLSTHNSEEIAIANSLDLNYIGLGAYRSTSTKVDAGVLGATLDTLAEKSKHPVAAIGGIKTNDEFEFVTYHVIGSGLL